ncbi:MAG: hypothetical protein KatS3mg033_0042 [Thermonema sp.]|nr:MAG: hypothetical protein KatS3mg033_0042 [Thermonema sp.]
MPYAFKKRYIKRLKREKIDISRHGYILANTSIVLDICKTQIKENGRATTFVFTF